MLQLKIQVLWDVMPCRLINRSEDPTVSPRRVDLSCQTLRMEAVLGFPLVPVFFPGQSRFTGFKELCPDVTRNSVWEARCPGVFQVIKYDISDNVYEYFDFGTVRDNVYRSSTGISQLLTGRNMTGETGSCVKE